MLRQDEYLAFSLGEEQSTFHSIYLMIAENKGFATRRVISTLLHALMMVSGDRTSRKAFNQPKCIFRANACCS